MTNSKRKGNAFENKIAKQFSEHFNDTFKRTPSSGALVGGQNRFATAGLRADANEILASDIISPEWFPFLLECKNYNDDPKFHLIVQGDCKVLDEWIGQADGDSEYVNKRPLIIFKLSRRGEYVCFDRDLFDKLFSTKIAHISYKGKIVITLDEFLQGFGRSQAVDLHTEMTTLKR